MDRISDTWFGKVKVKEKYIYPTLHFPTEYGDIIGHKVTIYQTEDDGKRAFMLILDDDTLLPEKVIQHRITSGLERRMDILEKNMKEMKELVGKDKKPKTNRRG